jgi:uncharacterized protein (TIGR02594 family)
VFGFDLINSVFKKHDMTDLLKVALSEYGVKEISGDKHNPEVLKYFHDIGHEWVKDDEMAWCAAFVNWCCLKAGYENTGSLSARSFLEIGKTTINPKIGNLVIFWRESIDSIYGHVGIFIREENGLIYTLGGNQSNQVKISVYPIDQLLGFRKLKKI